MGQWGNEEHGDGVGTRQQQLAVSLSGTMEVTATGFRVPYSGMTCLGPVSGTEMMGKG